MIPPARTPMSDEAAVRAYHDRTKHHLDRYARSLGYLDWATQPDPFRRYAGAPAVSLDRPAPQADPRFDDVAAGALPPPAPRSLGSISRLLFDALALSAWKRAGSSRWSLRCNPSSGNLHPTEGYLILPAVEGIHDTPAAHHYAPFAHALERRREITPARWSALTEGLPPGSFFVALTSVHWREAWKYGERAYRYCQLDVGHAVAQFAYAAAALGWRARVLDAVPDDAITALTATEDPGGAEPEHPDALLLIAPAEIKDLGAWSPSHLAELATTPALGAPNALSATHHPWPVIDEVAHAARHAGRRLAAITTRPAVTPFAARDVPARSVFRTRRSAVAMDARTALPRDAVLRILARLMPCAAPPWDALPWAPLIHPFVLVHRAEGLAPGAYLLVRDPVREKDLRAFIAGFPSWERADESLPLYRLAEGDTRAFARTSNCHQEIAADGVLSVAMLADFDRALREGGPSAYRRMFWEAGALGQSLYLEAEAAGVRGTGIGCFFDDAIHDALGITGHGLQSLYGFTLGGPEEDPRIETEPAYAHLDDAR